MSSTAIGIDLGTTFSATSFVNKHGVTEIIPNEQGERITPSVIFFDNNQIIVGAEAERAAVAYPLQVVQFVKRHIGEEDYKFTYNGKDWNAVELSAQILKALVDNASARLNEKITQAVITVPAYFGQNQRNATIQAAESIGLEVLKIINEPTAAAVAYGLNQLQDKNRCLVFDLGGGTFDVTIVEIQQNTIRVKGTDGDHQLGGKDWDDRLMKHVAEAFKSEHGVDIMEDVLARHDLRERCVQAKLGLTMRPEVTLTIQFDNKPLRLKITRTQFEAITADLLKRCEDKTMEALQEANFVPQDIDTILLVGGSTKMPMVRHRIKEIFNKDPSTDINPDECVAMGAAITASIESAIRRDDTPPVDIKQYDVTGHQLGLVVLKDERLYNAPIIKKNTPIPCEQTQTHFITTHPNQAVIDLWLAQGDSKDPLKSTNNILGHFEFYNIPMHNDQLPIAITYRYNANGIVEVESSKIDDRTPFAHRMSKDKYTLGDVRAGKIPSQISIILDTSGSMYGTPLLEAQQWIYKFAQRNLRNNRSIALFTYPEGMRQRPVNDLVELQSIIENVHAIGYSTIHTELRHAREHTKGRSGIYIIISDGHLRSINDIQRNCDNIHKTGGKVFVVGVGAHQDSNTLQSIASHPKYYLTAEQDLDLTPHLVNLLQHT